ncbi:MAG: hypothetical protein A6D92_00830 [Symbiobacterium thermophilum]|uniref:Uncharacterized protein n=1 Tax=Symbiobacterium thermophilum TaxID=2734 RepID=A0A1Y2T914_SYMTR|nr:MAG: hypothetical protein A6D92_00830 [Symbiobacterium thermophilum]
MARLSCGPGNTWAGERLHSPQTSAPTIRRCRASAFSQSMSSASARSPAPQVVALSSPVRTSLSMEMYTSAVGMAWRAHSAKGSGGVGSAARRRRGWGR